MTRRVLAALLLAALTTFGSAAPWPGLAPSARAVSCSGWSSHNQPPPTIRVFRHRTGAVDTVSFKAYTKNVLSREWIGSWSTESLRSGALAVKTYAWYQVLHWRGGMNADGQCFDLRDDTWDQVYDPGQPTWSTAAAAVNATWSTVVHKNGRIFPTYYNAGAPGESCGANANGWKAFQWGTQACGQAGMTASQIIRTYYYPGVRVSSPSPPPATPSPTPSATPAPSPTPMPTTQPTPGTSPTPRPSATSSPTLSPTPSPTPTPAPSAVLPTPPPAQALPGGGQEGVQDATQPPPPPPAAPEPVVAPAAKPDAAAAAVREGLAAWELRRRDEALRRVDRASQPPPADMTRGGPTDPRLLAFVAHWQEAIDGLTAAVARHLAGASAIGRR